MKKRYLFVIFIIASFFYSCNNDDNNNLNTELISKWKFIGSSENMPDEILVDNLNECELKSIIEFTPTNFKQVSVYDSNGMNNCQIKSETTVTYSVSANKITLNLEVEGKIESRTSEFSIEEDILTIVFTNILSDGSSSILTSIYRKTTDDFFK